MNKTAYILLVMGLVLVAGIATAAPLVYLDPASLDICEGEFTIDVLINDEVVDLTGFDLMIDFDETIVSVVGVDQGQLLDDYPGMPFFYWTVEGTVSDALLINGAALGGSISGPGVLATITFACDANGLTDLEFEMVEFRDIDNLPIPVTSEDGEVNVDDDTVVYIDPVWDSVPIDTHFFVGVALGSGVRPVSLVNVTVSFDPSILELQGVDQGPLVPLGSTLTWSDGSGSVDIELDIAGSITGVTAVEIEFKGIFSGTSPLVIESVSLETGAGTVINPCVESGSVFIEPPVPVQELHWGMIKSLYR